MGRGTAGGEEKGKGWVRVEGAMRDGEGGGFEIVNHTNEKTGNSDGGSGGKRRGVWIEL